MRENEVEYCTYRQEYVGNLYVYVSCICLKSAQNWKILTTLKPIVHCMYNQFNIQQFCVLPTQCIYVFCVDLRTNSDYFPIQH
jgi:hypothetical protein